MIEASEDLIRRELSPGEQPLWIGRPGQGFVLRGSDVFLIPFSLLWGGFAIFWEASVLTVGAPWFFALWGIPFVLVGLYLIVGRFWVDMRQRANTVYAVTTERIIILSGLFTRRVKSLNIGALPDLSLTERRDGSGTITFGTIPYWYMHLNASWPGLGYEYIPKFELIPDARGVYDIIRQAQRDDRQSSA